MRSFTFNGIKKPWVIMLRGRQKAPFAPLRRNLLVVPGMHGAYLQSTDVEPIIINQPIGFKVDDDVHALQLKDELAEWLVTDEPVPLEFDDEPGRIYYAVVQNSIDDFEKFAELRQGTIQFLCPDPYAYGEEQTVTFTNGEGSPNVKGTAKTLPIITAIFTGSATEFKISLDDQFVRVIRNFVAGDELIIDNVRKKILYNGNLAMPTLDLYSTWIELSPGAQTLTVEPTGVADVEMTYTERWL